MLCALIGLPCYGHTDRCLKRPFGRDIIYVSHRLLGYVQPRSEGSKRQGRRERASPTEASHWLQELHRFRSTLVLHITCCRRMPVLDFVIFFGHLPQSSPGHHPFGWPLISRLAWWPFARHVPRRRLGVALENMAWLPPTSLTLPSVPPELCRCHTKGGFHAHDALLWTMDAARLDQRLDQASLTTTISTSRAASVRRSGFFAPSTAVARRHPFPPRGPLCC